MSVSPLLSSTTASIAEFHHVRYRYPSADTPILDNVSWNIPTGEFMLLAGPSGSGKSTLLRCLNGLVPHFSGGSFGGEVFVGPEDTRMVGPRDLSARVGFVFQDPESQLVTDRVDAELAFSLEQHGVDRIRMRKRVEEMLDLLGIAHLRDRHPSHLSGGEQQRVAVAAALSLHPTMLVLDEPTSQLDPWGAEDVLAALVRLNEDLGITIVLAEHRLERVLHRADSVRVLQPPPAPSSDGAPADVAARLDPIALPPVTQLGRARSVPVLPLTVKEARTAFRTTITLPESGPPPDQRSAPGAVVAEINGLSVDLDRRTVLEDLSLAVREGEFVAIMGRNGSGKTTLLRTMLGLETARTGTIVTCGVDVVRDGPAALGKVVGYLPQQARVVFFKDRVVDEIAFTIAARGGGETVREVVARFGLEGLEDRHPLDLSGGERERTALATVMAGQPRLLLLDEPTRGMDAWRKHELALRLRILQEQGVTILMATHDAELVAQFASRVIMLGHRDIIADGTPRDVLSGSLTFTTQINKVFGGDWLTVEDVTSAAVLPD
jgi:energy-coupling factor transport system ATP-binding protein